jgi:hypothetical protein
METLGDFGRIRSLVEEFHGLGEVLTSLFDTLALAGNIEFRAKRNEAVAFALDDRSELEPRHESEASRPSPRGQRCVELPGKTK